MLDNIKEKIIDTTYIPEQDKMRNIAVIIITDKEWCRLDQVLIKYYGKDKLHLLQYLLAYNNVSDPFEIELGSYFYIPDLNYLEDNLSEFDLSRIPGINNQLVSKHSLVENLMVVKTPNDNDEVEIKPNMQDKIDSRRSNDTTTVAMPKLNVKLRKVKYDEETGIIKY